MPDSTNWEAVGWLGFACVSVFFLAIGAICLTTACKLVGVKPPDFFPAMVFCFLVGMAVNMVWLFLGIVIGLTRGADLTSIDVYHGLLGQAAPIAFVMYPFVAAAIYSVVLPDCGILKGFFIWLLQVVVLGGLILLIVGCFYFAGKALSP